MSESAQSQAAGRGDKPADAQNDAESIDHLPDDLLEVLRAAFDAGAVEATAGHDLDADGRYAEGHLVLTDEALLRYLRRDGEWLAESHRVESLTHSEIIDGLGMKLLRLVSDRRAVAEYRFTLRHARQVAKLHRRLERKIAGKEPEGEEEPEKSPGEEKKLRCDKCGRAIPAWSEFCPACMSRRKVLSRLMDFVKPYKGRAIGGFCLAAAATAGMLARPFLTRYIVDIGLGAAPGYTADFSIVAMLVAVMGATVLVTAVGGALRQRLMAGLGSRIARDVRDTTYRHLHKLSLAFFSRKPTGSLITRITSDSDRIWDFVAFTVIEFIVSMMTIVGVGVALFVINAKLAAIVLLPIPLMLVLMVLFHRKMHRYFHRIFHRWSQMTAVVSDAIPGVRVIKAFSQEKREVDRFGDRNNAVYEGELTMINLWTLFGPVLQLCSQVGVILVWLVGGYWAVQNALDPQPGGMTIGMLTAFTSAMWMFYGPIHMLSHMDRMLNRAATSVQRIFEILDTEPQIYTRQGARAVEKLEGRIELQNVSFSYDGVRKVLQDVDLTIHPGEMIGLAGPSGAGKSTMINLICRFYDVLEGRILIDGVDLRDYDIEALRRRIGIVLQEPFLFHGTVAQNIAYGNPGATLEQIIESARAANAHDFIVGFPDGYDTLVGERGQTLSGGERQRISIARAVLNNPQILILDEATSSVDTETEKLIQEALDRLIADRTTIAIAHRLSTLRKADRLVILEKGRIVERGPHAELIARAGGVYAKLLRMQNETQSIMAIGG